MNDQWKSKLADTTQEGVHDKPHGSVPLQRCITCPDNTYGRWDKQDEDMQPMQFFVPILPCDRRECFLVLERVRDVVIGNGSSRYTLWVFDIGGLG